MDGTTTKLWPEGEEPTDDEGDFADNRVVCDSRNNCILADSLFIDFSKVGKVNIGGGIEVNAGHGTTGNAINVDKVGVFDVGGPIKYTGP